LSEKTPKKKSPVEVGRELFEKEEAAEREAGKKFDPRRILEKAREIKTIKDSVLGEVKYSLLSVKELWELNKISDEWERTRKMIFLLLHKAYPELKSEKDLDDFPAQEMTRLCELIASPENFFHLPQTSTPGSAKTKTPKSSVS
jgi:hypothetical protein